MTGLDVVVAILKKLGVLASGETPSANEANDALAEINRMMDGWSTQSLTIPATIEETFALIAGQQSYAFGSGGAFNSPRPQSIENALIQLPTFTPVINLPMNILNKDQWASIAIPSLTSNFPIYLYSDNAYPSTNVNVWPVPTAACNLVLFSRKALTQIASLTSTISLPPGYEELLVYNGAVRLAPDFGVTPSPTVISLAEISLGNIKRQNIKPNYAMVDEAIRAKPAVYDWRSDGYQR
jgi:hypothetical protein